MNLLLVARLGRGPVRSSLASFRFPYKRHWPSFGIKKNLHYNDDSIRTRSILFVIQKESTYIRPWSNLKFTFLSFLWYLFKISFCLRKHSASFTEEKMRRTFANFSSWPRSIMIIIHSPLSSRHNHNYHYHPLAFLRACSYISFNVERAHSGNRKRNVNAKLTQLYVMDGLKKYAGKKARALFFIGIMPSRKLHAWEDPRISLVVAVFFFLFFYFVREAAINTCNYTVTYMQMENRLGGPVKTFCDDGMWIWNKFFSIKIFCAKLW